MDNHDLALEDFLAMNKKESIEQSCSFFDVPYKKSWSKKKMAEALAEGIRKDPLKLFFTLPDEGLRFLASLFRKNGTMELDPMKRPYKPKVEEDFVNALELLTLFGLVQVSEPRGETMRVRISAPHELKKIMTPFLKKEMRQFAESIDMMADIVRGLLYYYGVMEMGALVGMMREKVPAFPQDLCRAVVRVRAPLGHRVWLQEVSGREYAVGFHTLDMDHEEEAEFVEDLVKTIELKTDFDYKSFSPEELLEASIEGFMENGEEYVLLLEELWDYFIFDGGYYDEDGEEIAFMSEQLSDEQDFRFFMDSLMEDLRQRNDISRTLHVLEDNMDFPTMKVRNEVFAHVRSFTDRISRFAFKGHTPLEMEGMGRGEKAKVIPLRKNDKVGRNDPCPCGSGKKYKNCHGKGRNPLN